MVVDEEINGGPAHGAEPEEAVARKQRHDAFTPERRRAFVEALKKKGCVLDACRAVGVSNRTAYNWYEADRDFARQWDVAVRMAAEDIEVAAYERGVVGVEEPVWAYGKLVGTRIRRSDSILRLLLVGSNRKKYGAVSRPPRKRILAWEKKRIEQEVRARLEASRPSTEEVDEAITGKLRALQQRLPEHTQGTVAPAEAGASGQEGANTGGAHPSVGGMGDFSLPHESRELHGGGDGGEAL